MKNRNKLVIAIWIVIGLTLGFANNALAMTFTVATVQGGTERYIQGFGAVEDGDVEKLQAILDNNNLPSGTYLSLHSGGGIVDVGHELASLIRDSGLNTIVVAGNLCLSACTDIFLGGNTRIMQQNGGLGYHAASVSDEWMASVKDIYILEVGQWLGIKEINFGLQYITPGKHLNFVRLLFDVHDRDDSSVMMYPSAQTLFDAGITTSV